MGSRTGRVRGRQEDLATAIDETGKEARGTEAAIETWMDGQFGESEEGIEDEWAKEEAKLNDEVDRLDRKLRETI